VQVLFTGRNTHLTPGNHHTTKLLTLKLLTDAQDDRKMCYALSMVLERTDVAARRARKLRVAQSPCPSLPGAALTPSPLPPERAINTGGYYETATLFSFFRYWPGAHSGGRLTGSVSMRDTCTYSPRPGTDLSGLPPATERQRRDILKRLEQTLWGGNLVLFGARVRRVGAGRGLFGSVIGMVLAVAS